MTEQKREWPFCPITLSLPTTINKAGFERSCLAFQIKAEKKSWGDGFNHSDRCPTCIIGKAIKLGKPYDTPYRVTFVEVNEVIPTRGNKKVLKSDAVLNEQDVIKIRDLLRVKIPKAHIAKQFGVSKTTIYDIEKGRSWNQNYIASVLKRTSTGNTKLSSIDTIREIKRRIKSIPRPSDTSLGKEFGMSRTAIYDIRKGRSWADIS